jgi:hypothetical protein
MGFDATTRAKAFERDRATCSYGGGSLWAFDAGAATPQCDHYVPRSRGGPQSLDNARMSCWQCNNHKRARRAPPVLVSHGKVTMEGDAWLGVWRETVQAHLARMAQLHWTDYYLASAANSVCSAVTRIHEGSTDEDAKLLCTSASKSLAKWRTVVAKSGVKSPEARGLGPALRDEAHEIMWSIKDCRKPEELLDRAHRMLKFKERDNPVGSIVPHCDAMTGLGLGR